MRSLISLSVLTSVFLIVSQPLQASSSIPKNEALKKRANILLIVADDLGFGDIGAYGSEISTPNIDALAANGSRFSSFYTQASCSPTRSMLLSGVDNHLNGMGTMAEDLMPHHKDLPGYSGYLNKEVVTVATLLQDSGYHTYMTGKWHLGYTDDLSPHARGFEHTFSLLNGSGNHFNDQGTNINKAKSIYRRDGVIASRPDGYSSDLFTKEMKLLIDKRIDDDKPFFGYLSFTAPHFPLQAPSQSIKKYKGRYDAGWDLIRENRFNKMKELGFIAANTKLPASSSDAPNWESLSENEKKHEARKMEVYAAMVDNLDANVGNMLQYLKDIGEYDNTVIIFMSDNGADPYDRSERQIYKDFLSEYDYDQRYENMGSETSYLFQGPGWAQTSSVYQQGYKFLPSEGGIHNPIIMRFPGMLDKGEVMTEFSSILDITPTLLELAGATHPGNNYKERKVHPLSGRSMLPYVSGKSKQVYADNEAVSFELFGHSSVFMGEWKAVKIRPPQGNNKWALYDIKTDLSETNDLSDKHPKILQKLTQAYKNYELKNGVLAEPDGITAYPENPHYVQYKN